jgi:uncharacterized heparinase superfamily protein
MPMLRFFRLGDGTMARFNGAGPTQTDALATVLAYDDIEGAPVRTAANSGYVRVEAGTALIICDLGPPPVASLSTKAHAGFLSFEISSRTAPMIINCGARGRLARRVLGRGQRHPAACRRYTCRPGEPARRILRSGRQSAHQRLP